MKLVAYLRVSTDTQAEKGLGLDVQRAEIKAWAKANGHRVVSWHADEGQSGSNGLDSRVALADALDALREGRARGIVCYRLDRLARDLLIQESLLADIRRAGAQAFTTSAGEQDYLADDPNDPSRKLIRQILGSVAEYERALIVLRLKSGRRRKHEQGGFAYGAPGYGYKADDKALAPDEREQAALARIRELRDGGASIRQIIQALDAEGITSKRGNAWNPGTLSRIIARMDREATSAA